MFFIPKRNDAGLYFERINIEMMKHVKHEPFVLQIFWSEEIKWSLEIDSILFLFHFLFVIFVGSNLHVNLFFLFLPYL
jgi:hypothetical protein